MSAQELLHAFGPQDRKFFRERYLAPALAAGLVEKTIAVKPNSRLQKYRLSDNGRRWPQKSAIEKVLS